jgi:hypothetical protein
MTLLRRLFLLAAVAFVLALAPPARAGSYLDRAALLLDESRREGDLLQPRTNDKELAMVVKGLAEARARVGRKMDVPTAVARAHPHLLLVLENWERAADAAYEGNFKKFMEHLLRSRDEDRLFRAVIAEMGFALPDLSAKK